VESKSRIMTQPTLRMPLAPPLIEETGTTFAKMRMPRFLVTGRNGGGLRLGVAMEMRLSGTQERRRAGG
jgi:hypothetical protein